MSTQEATFNFIPSFDENRTENQNLIVFSHIPKSAGTSFNSAIIAAYGQHGIVDYLVGRIYKNNLMEIKEKVDNYVASNMVVRGFISTTIPLETVSTFNIPVRLITIIREPVERVISHYCYECMRSQTKPTLDGLTHFYRAEENQNLSCKTLLGRESVSEGDGLATYDMLCNYYYAFCPVTHINALIMSVLSTEGLPNVVMGRENYTLAEYKLEDISVETKKEIFLLNQEDYILYKKCTSGYRIPNPVNKRSVSGNTIKITCDQNEERYKGVVESFLTSELGKYAPNVSVKL